MGCRWVGGGGVRWVEARGGEISGRVSMGNLHCLPFSTLIFITKNDLKCFWGCKGG